MTESAHQHQGNKAWGLSAAHSPPAGADLPEQNATKLRPEREGGGGEMEAKLTQI